MNSKTREWLLEVSIIFAIAQVMLIIAKVMDGPGLTWIVVAIPICVYVGLLLICGLMGLTVMAVKAIRAHWIPPKKKVEIKEKKEPAMYCSICGQKTVMERVRYRFDRDTGECNRVKVLVKCPSYEEGDEYKLARVHYYRFWYEESRPEEREL